MILYLAMTLPDIGHPAICAGMLVVLIVIAKLFMGPKREVVAA